MDQRHFAHPEAAYLPAPFWSWNDKLEPERLLHQLQMFKEARIGGFFMHARPGLHTPFLSEEWFAAISTCVEYARRHDMKAWIYDESSYPSGFAGGFVPERRPDLVCRHLVCRWMENEVAGDRERNGKRNGREENKKTNKENGEELARFFVVGDGYRRLASEAPVDADARLLCFSVQPGEPSNWMNGFPYTDLLNPETTATFIDIALEPYRRRYATDFGGVIPGVFTDEPRLVNHSLPWTADLPELYRRAYGCDLLDSLPELFLEIGNYGVTRCRFWRLITLRFIEAWMRPMYEWCERHGLLLTGHLWEHLFTPNYTGSIMTRWLICICRASTSWAGMRRKPAIR